jgi:hypothetical protein
LVSEFQKIDDAFQQRNMSDLKIGQVGLERLKKISENLQLVQVVPQLPMVIPFLDLTVSLDFHFNFLMISDFRFFSRAIKNTW